MFEASWVSQLLENWWKAERENGKKTSHEAISHAGSFGVNGISALGCGAGCLRHMSIGEVYCVMKPHGDLAQDHIFTDSSPSIASTLVKTTLLLTRSL